MNPQRRELAATFFSLLGALFLWSSWAAQRGAPMFHPAFLHKPTPIKILSPEEKLNASTALGNALRDPAAITKKDLKDAKQAFGKDGERMLKLLKASAL